MFTIENMTFKDWLIEELDKREWSQAELARKAGVARATISNLLNEVRNPGTDLLEAVATAFGYSPEYVFRIAGLLPPIPEETERLKRLTYLFNLFPEDEQEDLLTYLEIKLQMLEKEGRIKK